MLRTEGQQRFIRHLERWAAVFASRLDAAMAFQIILRSASRSPCCGLWPRCHSRALAARAVEQLRSMVKEAKTPQKASPVRRHSPISRALGDGTGKWRCCDCRVEKTVADFYVTADGVVNSYCISCKNKRNASYKRTLRGNASVLVSSARRRANLKGWACDLDVDFILNLILQQQGRCAYSGVEMEMLLPHSDWRMSLERLDNGVGYEPQNCVLIAAEFNTSGTTSKRMTLDARSGSSKWSVEKVQRLSAERCLNVDLKGLDQAIQAARFPKQHLALPQILSEPSCRLERAPELVRCSHCEHWKPNVNFSLHRTRSSGFQAYCKQCHSAYRLARRMTLRGHIQELLGSARSRHKHGKWHGDFELDVETVLDMLWSQEGRCFYSDVPLKYAQINVDWQMSLERLNNHKTYTQDNTVLAALEFNTPDNSMNKASSLVFGSSQWSAWKVAHVWGSATCLIPGVVDKDSAVGPESWTKQSLDVCCFPVF